VAAPERFTDAAPAKVNLTLRVVGRRPDGYHDLESLVAFADIRDELSLTPDGELALTVSGPSAAQAGEAADNLVVKAALALAARVPDLRLGTFHLDKRLPVAAGLGGGSADAAAALRLLARANGIAVYDVRLFEAARATGADVPVCLDPRPRLMRGIGDILSAPLTLPPLPAVLVNPGVAVATKSVFIRWTPAAEPVALDLSKFGTALSRDECLRLLALHGNDLESLAIALEPTIAEVLAALHALPGCRLARMSGSGATCFALFAAAAAAIEGAQTLAAAHPKWWVRATALGGG
jgi:4-diphosphocytidyl-2-C-methyl-D-erythritol kinase